MKANNANNGDVEQKKEQLREAVNKTDDLHIANIETQYGDEVSVAIRYSGSYAMPTSGEPLTAITTSDDSYMHQTGHATGQSWNITANEQFVDTLDEAIELSKKHFDDVLYYEAETHDIIVTSTPDADDLRNADISLSDEEIEAIIKEYNESVDDIAKDKLLSGDYRNHGVTPVVGTYTYGIIEPTDWWWDSMEQISEVSGRTEEDLAREFMEKNRGEGDCGFDSQMDKNIWTDEMRDHMMYYVLGFNEFSFEVSLREN